MIEERGSEAKVERDNESPPEPESTDARSWQQMIDRSCAKFEYWHERCDKAERNYANLKRLAGERTDREMQMFYANMEVLKPTVYARPPQPVVAPRFNDRDPVQREAAEILERVVISNFDRDKAHETLKLVRNDMLLFGRGVPWVRLEEYQDQNGPKECVRWDWVHRRDYTQDPARCWAETGWVARRAWLTREDGVKRFGKEWTNITYDNEPGSSGEDSDSEEPESYSINRTAAVWEIWHRKIGKVAWLHPGRERLLDLQDPHLNLEGFFPCPKPALGTAEPGTLMPVPEYLFYKDQLEEIHTYTARISALADALRMKGFYPAGMQDVGDAIENILRDTDHRATLVGVPMDAVARNGSMKDMIVWMPVSEIAGTIINLLKLRRQTVDDVYQISGISDIMRGDTAASETLGAQELKSRFGSVRVRDRQEEMARIASELIKIGGEIIAENFEPESLLAQAGESRLPREAQVQEQAQAEFVTKRQQALAQLQQAQSQEVGQPAPMPDPQQIEQKLLAASQKKIAETVTIEKVTALLRAQRIRPFVMNVATESTLQADEGAEKQQRTEFLTAAGAAMQQFMPMLMNPTTSDFAGEMIKFALAPFRAGRELDAAVDDMIARAKEQASSQAGQEKPPSPEMIKAQQDQQAFEREQQAKAAEDQRQSEAAQREAAFQDAERRIKMAEAQQKAEADARRMAHEARMAQYKERLAELQVELAATRLAQTGVEAEAKAVEAMSNDENGLQPGDSVDVIV